MTSRRPRARAVFLDRDGVLVRAVVRGGRPYPPSNATAMEIEPDAPGCLAALRAAGFLLISVTNQPDVARGTQRREVVDTMHARLREVLPLDDLLVCWHDEQDACACRKPRPGLLHAAATTHHLDLHASWLIGDRWRDVDAAHSAGCRAVLVDRGYRERSPTREPEARVPHLAAAVAFVLSQESRTSAPVNEQ